MCVCVCVPEQLTGSFVMCMCVCVPEQLTGSFVMCVCVPEQFTGSFVLCVCLPEQLTGSFVTYASSSYGMKPKASPWAWAGPCIARLDGATAPLEAVASATSASAAETTPKILPTRAPCAHDKARGPVSARNGHAAAREGLALIKAEDALAGRDALAAK